MKRIALALLTGIVLLASCNNDKPVPGVDPNPTDPTDPRSSKGRISLQILVPMSGVKTYAGEAASTLENRIDTVYVDLYQGGGTPINQSKFYGTDLAIAAGTNDSILTVGYEVDNIATGTLTVKVYANRKDVKTITGEIPTPDGTPSKSFFMSGEATLTGSGPYSGVVHLVRDVAKLRVNVSLNSVYFPSDMTIDYANIKIEAIQVPNQTSLFGPTADAAAGQSGFAYINYAERTVRINPGTSGGMVDSMYLNENIRSSYTTGTMTKIKLTIPTISATEGAKTDSYTFDLYTDGKYDILRNYIYTLDIKVRGQSLEPVITLNVLPWDDVSVDGNIYGTYLTTNTSEIEFDSNGEAWIEFCTDAQAVYFDFSEFNANNDVAVGPEDGAYSEIIGKGISEADPALAPNGFIDGQILLDHQHCGRFGFKLDDNPSLIANFPTFPQLNFTGKICIKAGNVVKCLFFPARRAYDAHFIVGDTLLSGEMFTYAETYGGSWIEVSPDRKYTTNAGTTYSGAAARLYLHLDENLTGVTRTGSVLARNSAGVEKKVFIEQLPAVPIGRFGINSASSTDTVFNTVLWAEQLKETPPSPVYKATNDNVIVGGNSIYNGLVTAQTTSPTVFDPTPYNSNAYFSWSSWSPVVYQAINYCAYKNRHTPKTLNGDLAASDVKWYLPSQAQLMAMWLSYPTYSNESGLYPRSNFVTTLYWASTGTEAYPNSAQYMNFAYGNMGYYPRTYGLWLRCVRAADNGSFPTSSMMVSGTYPTVDFSQGMPAATYTTATKGTGTGNEASATNQTVFKQLRVAVADASTTTVNWATAGTLCGSYSESGTGGWRLPTQREMQAIWILQKELRQTWSTFNYLSSDRYYWTATESSTATNNYYAVYGSRNVAGSSGLTSNIPGSETNIVGVRCVKEIP